MKRFSFLLAIVLVVAVSGNAMALQFNYTNDTDYRIYDYGWVNSDIVVSGATGVITDLNLNIVIDHTYLADLEIHLDHFYDGQSWSWIMNDDGGSYNNMDVNFDDEAALSINGYNPGSNNLTGTFRPEEALAMYDGFSLNGVWRLTVHDDAGWDTGYLREWSIYGTDSNTAPVPEPATMLLLGTGLCGLIGSRYRRKKA